MTTKDKLAAITAKIKMMESKLASAKTKRAPKGRAKVSEAKASKGVAYLIESELEKAEVLLVAKSVIDKLQKVAEDLAKIDGTDIMPAMEGLKAAFGPEEAQAFQQAAADQLRNAVNGVTAAKDAIGAHVAKFEGVLNGDATNDMASIGDDPAVPALDGLDDGAAADADALGGDEIPMDGADAAMGATGAPDAAAGDDDMASLDGMFDDAGTDTAAGRAKKESVAPKGRALREGEFVKGKKGVNPFAKKDDKKKDDTDEDNDKDDKKSKGEKALAESKNPDALILSAFRRLLAESGKPVPAAKAVSRHFGIDFADVVAIVQETRLGK